MKYEDEEENFLSDKKIEERYPQSDTYRRRGGSYENQIKENNEEKKNQKVENEESGDIFNTVIIIIAIIVIIIAIFVMIKVFKGTSDTNEEQNTNNNVTQTDNSYHKNLHLKILTFHLFHLACPHLLIHLFAYIQHKLYLLLFLHNCYKNSHPLHEQRFLFLLDMHYNFH